MQLLADVYAENGELIATGVAVDYQINHGNVTSWHGKMKIPRSRLLKIGIYSLITDDGSQLHIQVTGGHDASHGVPVVEFKGIGDHP